MRVSYGRPSDGRERRRPAPGNAEERQIRCRQGRELRKAQPRAKCVAAGGLDRDRSLRAVELHRSRVTVGSNALDAGDGTPAEKLQRGWPVVRGLITQQELDLAARPGRDVRL